MATISEDFLNSLSADERDDFIRKMMEVLSMNSSQQDEITAQNIRGLYQNHQGKVIKCNFCRKDELEDQEFGQCARCGLAQYCSKECQKRHWKQHKIECLKCQDGDHQTALNKKLGWRMDQFSNFYTPLIAKLVLDMYSRHNKQFNTGDILFPENAVVELALADLPQSAKRPRLYIKQAFVAELSKYETEAAFSRASRPETGYQCVRYCLSYSYGTGEDETFFSYYQFQLPLSAAKQLKRIENKNVGEHLTAINSIAKGKNPKVYKVIKQVLKEKNG